MHDTSSSTNYNIKRVKKDRERDRERKIENKIEGLVSGEAGVMYRY